MKGRAIVPGAARRSRRPSPGSSTTTRSASRATTRSRRRCSPASSSDKIERVTVKSAAGEQTTIEKQGTAWQMTQPAAAPADEAELSGITSNLASLEVQQRGRRTGDRPEAVRPRPGADRGDVQVRRQGSEAAPRAEDADRRRTSTPRLPDKPRVFLVSSYLESTFNKSTFDLRDKTILKIDREKVDRMEIETAGSDR